jgi:hypothetical protein
LETWLQLVDITWIVGEFRRELKMIITLENKKICPEATRQNELNTISEGFPRNDRFGELPM